jgi:NTP pyrophosphatase (non-canonical NTP hydrolase)
MEIKEYTEKAALTDAPLDSTLMHDLHMSLGMVTESAELADVFKKNIAYGKEIDWVNVQEEIGDLMWYVVNFCRVRGWSLEKILQTNIDKLASRYPNKFTQEDAINRNLGKEREILEK